MTTVCWDGRYLAADTLAHRNGVPSRMGCRKIDICDGFAYAISGGYAAMLGTLIAWHRAGAKPDEYPQHGNGSMLIIDLATRQAFVVTDKMPYLDEEGAPFTGGSGGDVALGAMLAGLSGMEAVKIAAACDTHTNDTIDFIDCEFPEKGVQRWDGMTPSKAYPMPVRDWSDDLVMMPSGMVGLKSDECRYAATLDHMMQEVDEEGIPRHVVTSTTGLCSCEACVRVRAAARAGHVVQWSGEHDVTDWGVRPNTGSYAGVIGRDDLCGHGYVRRTCSACRDGTRKALDEVLYAKKANGHA